VAFSKVNFTVTSLKQGDALSPWLSKFDLEYAVRWVQVNQNSLKLNGTHQFWVWADDANILGGSIHTCTIMKNTVASVVASKEIGLDVNAEKTKYKSRCWLLWVITQRVMVIVWVRI
jgi:hypothetical protein